MAIVVSWEFYEETSVWMLRLDQNGSAVVQIWTVLAPHIYWRGSVGQSSVSCAEFGIQLDDVQSFAEEWLAGRMTLDDVWISRGSSATYYAQGTAMAHAYLDDSVWRVVPLVGGEVVCTYDRLSDVRL